jgi:hypothetical protein
VGRKAIEDVEMLGVFSSLMNREWRMLAIVSYVPGRACCAVIRWEISTGLMTKH